MNPVAPVTATRTKPRAPRSCERLLIDAIALVAARARLRRRLIDVAVVLEHPRELRPHVRAAADPTLQLEQEQRIETACAVLGQDAQQQQTHLIDVALPAQQPDQAVRKQPAAGALERLVDVRDRDRARNRLSVDFGADRASLIENRLELRSETPEFGFGRRHEGPVVLPRATVDGPHALDLTRELRPLQRPDAHALAIANASG